MTRKQWLKACKERLMRKGNIDAPLAEELAFSCLDAVFYDLSQDPVEVADEEMTYWGDC